jgi:hypothetical protein
MFGKRYKLCLGSALRHVVHLFIWLFYS